MRRRNVPFLLIFFGALFFTSCGVQVSLKPTDAGAEFAFSLDMGEAFLETIYGVSGIEDESVSEIFDCEEIKSALSESDFYDVAVQLKGERTLHVNGKFKWNSENPLVLSKMVNPSPSKTIQVVFSAANLQDLYTHLPQDFKNYLDMFMAPSFTGEEMADSEYMDLLASVYGEALVKELQSASIKLTVLGDGQKPREHTVPLIKMLNIVGELRG